MMREFEGVGASGSYVVPGAPNGSVRGDPPSDHYICTSRAVDLHEGVVTLVASPNDGV